MTDPIQLRPYQEATVRAVNRHLADPDSGHGVFVLPTGGGKTFVFASLVRDWFERWGDEDLRVAILAHRYELLEQAEAKLLRVWPDAPVGVVSAGLGRREADRRIVIAGIQTVHDKAAEVGPFNAVIVDEAHLVPSDADSMFGRFLGDLQALHPRMRVIGCTATPYRLDGGLIYGPGKPFNRLIHEVGVRELIGAGHLCPLVTVDGRAKTDTSGVSVRAGEFVRRELEAAAAIPELVRAAVAELLAKAELRRSVLVFACGVEHARLIRDALRAAGEDAEVITGETPNTERAGILARFDAGLLRFVVNVEVLTTGLDVERIDAIACLRPTQSTGLWVQMIGRGLRVHPSKADTLVLDFTENTILHGPIDNPDVQRRARGRRHVSDRICPSCDTVCPLSAKRCPSCGTVFERSSRTPTHGTRATLAAILGLPSGVYEVRAVHVSKREREGKPPMLRVGYAIGPGRHDWVDEFVLLEHDGFAKQKAAWWWSDRFGWPVPKTVDEALAVPALAHRIREVTEGLKLNTHEPFPIVGHVLRATEADIEHARATTIRRRFSLA